MPFAQQFTLKAAAIALPEIYTTWRLYATRMHRLLQQMTCRPTPIGTALPYHPASVPRTPGVTNSTELPAGSRE